jgi:hypothetical protein
MPDGKVRQVLLTLFNHRLNSHFHNSLDEAWLRHRWGVFSRVTVPSIAGQSTADFDWVIRLHEASPRWLLDAAAALEVPCRLRLMVGQADASTTPELDDLRDPSLEAVLLTRIDSDDALQRTAMARLRESYQEDPSSATVLNFQVGYRMDYATARLGLFFHYSPSCLTFVHRQPIVNPIGWGGNHFDLPDLFPFRAVDGGQPMFLQTAHGRNISTNLRRIQLLPWPVSAHILRAAFNIDAEQLLGVCWAQPLDRVLRRLGPSGQGRRRKPKA